MKINHYKQNLNEEEYKSLKKKLFNSNLIVNCIVLFLSILFTILSLVIIFSTRDTTNKVLTPLISVILIVLIKSIHFAVTQNERKKIADYEELQDIINRTKLQKIAEMELFIENEQFRNYIKNNDINENTKI